jgi:hypothetical protein
MHFRIALPKQTMSLDDNASPIFEAVDVCLCLRTWGQVGSFDGLKRRLVHR